MSQTEIPATTKKRLRRAEREPAMLKVAAEIFGARGYHAASMDEIASAAGITKPMLYAYFGSKSGLYQATVQHSGRALFHNLQNIVNESDPAKRLHLACQLIFRFIQKYRAAWNVLFGEGGRTDSVAREVQARRDQLAALAGRSLWEFWQTQTPIPTGRALFAEAEGHALLGAGEALAKWWLQQDENVITLDIIEARMADLVERFLSA